MEKECEHKYSNWNANAWQIVDSKFIEKRNCKTCGKSQIRAVEVLALAPLTQSLNQDS